MPPHPTPPPSLHTLLSSLRSQVFQTAHNPHNTRTGAKYLRKRLVGPSAINYYPHMPKLSTLNAKTPWNVYGGWEGNGSGAWRSAVVDNASSGQRETYSSSSSGQKEGEEGKEIRWANQGLMLSKREVVEEGYEEVGRIKGSGWVDDAKERVRREEVDINRLMGRGPPKKGQGKRSQMKKR